MLQVCSDQSDGDAPLTTPTSSLCRSLIQSRGVCRSLIVGGWALIQRKCSLNYTLNSYCVLCRWRRDQCVTSFQ